MKVQKNHLERLLDALDHSLNSNTAWLHFDIYDAQYFELNRFLIKQLRSGFFHLRMVENDLFRGWENMVSITYSKYWKDKPIVIPLPGNCWNGKEDLSITEVSEKKVTELLNRFLTAKHGSEENKHMEKDKAKSLVREFMEPIKPQPNKMVTYHLIEPDFLYTVEDYYASDYTQVGYFENQGKDFVIAFLTEDHNKDVHHLKLLLTNGGL